MRTLTIFFPLIIGIACAINLGLEKGFNSLGVKVMIMNGILFALLGYFSFKKPKEEKK